MDTREERRAKGKPVGKVVPYAAMGGLTGFSSLMDGYMRLDDSGIGAPPLAELESTPMPPECKYFMPLPQLQVRGRGQPKGVGASRRAAPGAGPGQCHSSKASGSAGVASKKNSRP